MPEKDIPNKSSDASIPPPLDPFPTYQTPYPRSNHNDDNPFIQFRRFADEQLSSFFQGIPHLFGFSSPRDPFKRDLEDLIRQSHQWEEGWRKQFEQEMEEMRQELERSRTQAWKPRENPPKDNTLSSARGGATNQTPGNEKEPEDIQAWPTVDHERDEPRTELDAYNGFQQSEKATDIPIIKPSSRESSNNPVSSWLSSFGWDGKQREREHELDKKKACNVSSSEEDSRIARPTTYTLFGARRMNPFDNTDHTIPWLLLSPYSPLYLSNPSESRLFKIQIQDAEGESLQISRPRFFERWYTDIDEKLARQIPWADAFEDLLSLQQTGKMVDRDVPTWRMQTDWIHGLIRRGSLGPAWGSNQEGAVMKRFSDMKATDKETSGGHESEWHMGRGSVRGREPNGAFTSTAQSTSGSTETSEDLFDDFVDSAAERLGPFPLFGSILSAADSIISAVDQATKDFETVLSGARPSSQADSESPAAELPADPPSYSTSSSSLYSYETGFSSSRDEQVAPSESIIATLTTTVTRTLPDGSVETKRVLKRRFADGTEETDESVEVKNLPSIQRTRGAETSVDKETQTLPTTENRNQVQQVAVDSEQTAKQEDRSVRSRKGGWFWT